MFRTRTCDGIALAILTLLLILYGVYCANKFAIFYWYHKPNLEDQMIQGIPLSGWGTFYFLTFNTISLLAIISHQRASAVDPGRIPEGMKAPFKSEYNQMLICEKCTGQETWKPARAHHCRECGFCVFKMDHHCPWINNCVGHRNLKYFVHFCSYTGVAAIYLSFLMCISFYQLLSCAKPKLHMNKPWYPYVFVMCILAFVEGLLFAFFTYELI